MNRLEESNLLAKPPWISLYGIVHALALADVAPDGFGIFQHLFKSDIEGFEKALRKQY